MCYTVGMDGWMDGRAKRAELAVSHIFVEAELN